VGGPFLQGWVRLCEITVYRHGMLHVHRTRGPAATQVNPFFAQLTLGIRSVDLRHDSHSCLWHDSLLSLRLLATGACLPVCGIVSGTVIICLQQNEI